MLQLLLLLACADPTQDDSSTTCNEANEACAPGSCDGEGGNMLPGADCLSCHSSGSGEEEAKAFSVAGTAFADMDGTEALSGAVIRVTGDDGTVIELTSNSSGNFYTEEPVVYPITAEVEVGGTVQAMSQSVETGACSSCHSCAGSAGGKLTGP